MLPEIILTLGILAPDELRQFADSMFHGQRLGIQLLGTGGTFLGTGGVGLRDFIHLIHGRINLGNALGLFVAGARHLLGQSVHFPCLAHNRHQGFGHFFI